VGLWRWRFCGSQEQTCCQLLSTLAASQTHVFWHGITAARYGRGCTGTSCCPSTYVMSLDSNRYTLLVPSEAKEHKKARQPRQAMYTRILLIDMSSCLMRTLLACSCIHMVTFYALAHGGLSSSQASKFLQAGFWMHNNQARHLT
jgi:hypothetical protein